MTTLHPSLSATPTEYLGGKLLVAPHGGLKVLRVANPRLFEEGAMPDPELLVGVPFGPKNSTTSRGKGFILGAYGNPVWVPASVAASKLLGGKLSRTVEGKEKTALRDGGIYRVVVWDVFDGTPTMVKDYDLSIPSTQDIFFQVVDGSLTVFVDGKPESLEAFGLAFTADQDEFRYSSAAFEVHLLPKIYCQDELLHLDLGVIDLDPAQGPVPSLGAFTVQPSANLAPAAPETHEPWVTTGGDKWEHYIYRDGGGWRLSSHQVMKGRKAFYALRTCDEGDVILLPEPEFESHAPLSTDVTMLPENPGRISGFIGKSRPFCNAAGRRKSLTHWQVLPAEPNGYELEDGAVVLTPAGGAREVWYPAVGIIKHTKHFHSSTRDVILRPEKPERVLDLAIDQLMVATYLHHRPGAPVAVSPPDGNSGISEADL